MSNYPDGFNPRVLDDQELPWHIENDHTRIHNKHAELMGNIRELTTRHYPLDDKKVAEFLIEVDAMFAELVVKFYYDLESDHGIRLSWPVSPERAQQLARERRDQIQNPQTLIDVAAANAAAAASVLDGEAVV